jgi:transposase
MEKELSMPVVNPFACGIDVGSKFHYVAVSQDIEDVRAFGVYTRDHQEMIRFLREHKVQTIAMESTGSYWQTLYAALLHAGFEVFLVCGNQTKNVKGRKTDVQDCQWIQWLHSVGMLSHSFIPDEFVSTLRLFARQRSKYVAIQTRIINQLQGILRGMNIRLEVAINDITGKSGRAILEAILNGERNPSVLAGLVDYRVKKCKEEIALSLEGNWNEAYLFLLKQQYREYKQNLQFIEECDIAMEDVLRKHLEKNEIAPEAPFHAKAGKKNKNKPGFDLQQYSYQYFGGVDLFAIEGINQGAVLTLISEVGNGIHRFRNAKAFASWLHLCPNEKITGGKVISNRTKRGTNPLAQALKSAANAIGNMKLNNHLCSFYKRIAYRNGRKEANTATAHKLAVIIYNMLTKYIQYIPFERKDTDHRTRHKTLDGINKLIKKFNITHGELNLS